MTRLTTHVLDTSTGRPAADLAVRLERIDAGGTRPVATGTTGADGRVTAWEGDEVPAGHYRLVFETGEWFKRQAQATMYPEVVIHFEVLIGEAHYHVPLLLAPFGYTTYRGS